VGRPCRVEGDDSSALHRADRDASSVGGEERRRVVEAQEAAEEAHGIERQSEEGSDVVMSQGGCIFSTPTQVLPNDPLAALEGLEFFQRPRPVRSQ